MEGFIGKSNIEIFMDVENTIQRNTEKGHILEKIIQKPFYFTSMSWVEWRGLSLALILWHGRLPRRGFRGHLSRQNGRTMEP
jgi:hypothetical protein